MSQEWNLPLDDDIVVSSVPGHITDTGQTLQTKFAGSSAPTGPATGQWWLDTSGSPAVLKIWDGAAWQTVLPDALAAYGGLIAADAASFDGEVSMGNNKLVDLDDGTDAGDALNKGQIDARAFVIVINLGTISASANIPVLCGGPAMTLLQVSLGVSSTVATDPTDNWDINLFNYNSDGSGSGSEIGAEILAADFSTSSTALTANETNDLGAFETDEDEIDADDFVELRLTKNNSAANLEDAILCIKYSIETA